jgi:aryl-alcohol dehydrogenase-like predicted oxidoreductase
VAELMQSLNQLVTAGKVLYLGISDSPAWVVSKANEYARNHGLRPFSVYQGRWSAASRDFEREIIPMARDEGMALAPWGALGGGTFKTAEQRAAALAGQSRAVPPSEAQIKVSEALERIAVQKNTVLTSVALAYVMHKAPYVFPIVGGRTPDHLRQNVEALSLRLSDEDIDEIEGAVPFDLGFPATFAYRNGTSHAEQHFQRVNLLDMGGVFDYVPAPQPIEPTVSKGGE